MTSPFKGKTNWRPAPATPGVPKNPTIKTLSKPPTTWNNNASQGDMPWLKRSGKRNAAMPTSVLGGAQGLPGAIR